MELEFQQKIENDFLLQQHHLNLEEQRFKLEAKEHISCMQLEALEQQNNMKLIKSVAYMLKKQVENLSQSQSSSQSQPNTQKR